MPEDPQDEPDRGVSSHMLIHPQYHRLLLPFHERSRVEIMLTTLDRLENNVARSLTRERCVIPLFRDRTFNYCLHQ